MHLTWDNISTILSVGGGVGGLILAALLYRARAEFAARAAVDDLGARLDAVETAQAALTARLDQMPTHADITSLRTELAGVAGDVRTVNATLATGLSGVRETLTLLMRQQLERVP